MEEDATTPPAAGEASGDTRLAILLAMAMFVLVVDTSLMNVSISAVQRSRGTGRAVAGAPPVAVPEVRRAVPTPTTIVPSNYVDASTF